MRRSRYFFRHWRTRRRPRRIVSGLAVVFAAALVLLILFGMQPGLVSSEIASVQAVAAQAPPPQWADRIGIDANQQIFSEDLTVEGGDVLPGDTVVYSGDVRVEEEGVIQGNLIVYSGDIEIEEGGTVAGDVTAFSGDVEVAGRIEGNLASASGDITLAESAWIGGDVSALSGDIQRDTGAEIVGNLVHGPNLRNVIPSLATLPGFIENMPAVEEQRVDDTLVSASGQGRPVTWGQRLGWFILSLIGATVFTIAATLLSGLVAAVWPQYIEKIESIGREQVPLSFAVGLLANLSFIFLTALLVVLICTIPFALALILASVAINIVGWTALAASVGKRAIAQSQKTIQPAIGVAVGALLLTAPLAFLYAFGSCFRFAALLLLFLLSSVGAGAVVQDLLHQLSERNKRRQSRRTDGAANNGDAEPPSPPAPAAPPEATAPDAAAVAQPLVESPPLADPQGDDFTRIDGLDLALERQLKERGILTFSQLAALTPETIADILGWSTEQVVGANINGQAAALAQQS